MSKERTLLLTDTRMADHDPGAGHPEQPRRLLRILETLAERPVPGSALLAPRAARREELLWVHTEPHVAMLEGLAGRYAQLDPDTAVSPASWDAALLAAGAAIEGVERLQRGEAKNAFALVRPPGHHAEPGVAMGFCLFNNAALAAEAALRGGAKRVAVLDWDVHHGNGTQAAFYRRSDVLYLSAHQFPFYPDSGAAPEIGEDEGRGFTVNVPLSGARRDADYGAVFDEIFCPILESYRPDFLVVSAGFDPHEADPIGGMLVTERGFAAMATRMRELADRVCGGRVLLVLEGGYDLRGLSESVRVCVEVLTGARDEFPSGASRETRNALAATRSALARYWPTLRAGLTGLP